MGAVNRIMITGASGFIGQATIAAALKAGLEVVAVQRHASARRDGVHSFAADLTSPDCVSVLQDALAQCDSVIHLAAAMSGAPEDHKRLTLGGTEHVLTAMARAGVGHLTLASSIAVFDTIQVPIGGDLTDDCVLENPAMSRDAYSGAKVRQENMARAARLNSLTIVRPGIVYDRSRIWNAHLGVRLGPILLRIGDDSPLPMCDVNRCAGALVQATLRAETVTFSVVDETLPTRGHVISVNKRFGGPIFVIPLPWQVPWVVARALRPMSGKLPGLLRENVLRQRCLPMGIRLAPPPFSATLPQTRFDAEGLS